MCQLAGWSRQACNLGRKQTLHLACESKLPENCQQWLVSVTTIRAFFILSKNRAWDILCYMKVSPKVLLKYSLVPFSLGGVLAKTHGHSTYFCLIPKPGTTRGAGVLLNVSLENSPVCDWLGICREKTHFGWNGLLQEPAEALTGHLYLPQQFLKGWLDEDTVKVQGDWLRKEAPWKQWTENLYSPNPYHLEGDSFRK